MIKLPLTQADPYAVVITEKVINKVYKTFAFKVQFNGFSGSLILKVTNSMLSSRMTLESCKVAGMVSVLLNNPPAPVEEGNEMLVVDLPKTCKDWMGTNPVLVSIV